MTTTLIGTPDPEEPEGPDTLYGHDTSAAAEGLDQLGQSADDDAAEGQQSQQGRDFSMRRYLLGDPETGETGVFGGPQTFRPEDVGSGQLPPESPQSSGLGPATQAARDRSVPPGQTAAAERFNDASRQASASVGGPRSLNGMAMRDVFPVQPMQPAPSPGVHSANGIGNSDLGADR